MNKTLFLCFLGSFLWSACSFRNNEFPNESSAAVNTIAVIVDDNLWNGEVGDSIRNKFASPVLGLPQEEPLFTINQYPVKFFEGFNSDSRNIIIIKKKPDSRFVMQENEFTKPQNVFHISGRSASEIISILEKNTSFIIQRMKATEIEHIQKSFKDSLQDIGKIKKKFNVELQIPSKYNYVMRRKNFIWLKNEIISGNTSLIIYRIPQTGIRGNNAVNDIVRLRDSIGRLYIHGATYGTRMVTEEAYSPYFSETVLAGCKTYETKGTWQMKNDYMSGPFISYSLFDKKNKRILVLEGFCYAPSKGKRDLMLELEAIIKSVQLK